MVETPPNIANPPQRNRPTWPKCARAFKPPRVRSLPWFRCRKNGCKGRLAQMDVVDGRTCIRMGSLVKFYDVLRCPKCGTEREFCSASI